MAKMQIGWFVLKEDKDFYNDFETAAWYERVAVKAGKYPLVVFDGRFYEDGELKCSVDSVYAEMEGTLVSDNFQTLFYGVPVGECYDTKKNAGKRKETHATFYTFQIAKAVVEGSSLKSMEGNYEFELLPEYEAKEIRFVSTYDNLEKSTYGIFKKEVA